MHGDVRKGKQMTIFLLIGKNSVCHKKMGRECDFNNIFAFEFALYYKIALNGMVG